MKRDTSRIKCGKHGEWKPWSIVCIHLLEGRAHEWISVPQEDRSDQYDWFCPECIKDLDRMAGERDISQWRPVCMDCVKLIRTVSDRN